MVAELLDWPHVNIVTAVQLTGNTVTAERAIEGGRTEVYEVGCRLFLERIRP